MKRKYVVAGLTSAFLLITGFCYSCAYHKEASAVLTASESEESTSKEADTGEVNTEVQSNHASEIVSLETQGPSKSEDKTETVQNQNIEAGEAFLYVHICGAVVNPGVYQAAEGARIVDMIELSGGLTKEAAGDYINQAQLITDGQRIYIPNKEDVEDLSTDEYLTGNLSDSEKAKVSKIDNALVNINTADITELMSLPGIGQTKADSIIEYRNANGKFKTLEELMNISGIKEGLFNQISSKIMVQ